jgi:YGGT family
MDSFTSPTTKPLYRGTQVVWYILGLLEILLAFRFVLKLLGANAGAGFTRFIYNSTSVFTAPFRAVFPSSVVEGSVFEWTTLLAMAVYWLVAYGIIRIFIMGKTVSTPEAAVKLNNQDRV